jgi:type I restriction enzyme R subunit
MAFITEADVEMMLLERLAGLGYSRATDAVIGPDGSASEREAYSDVILLGRLLRQLIV